MKTNRSLSACLLALVTLPVLAFSEDGEIDKTPLAQPGKKDTPAAADQDWRKVQEPMKALDAAQNKDFATDEEAGRFFAGELKKFYPAFKEFAERYPKDARRWQALVWAGDREDIRRNLDLPEAIPDLAAAMEEVLKAENAGPKEKAEASGLRIANLFADGIQDGKLSYEEWQKMAEAHLQEYPESRWNPNIRKQMEDGKFIADLKREPLELKFQSVNGEDIDLAKMRGKVVLLDFWASWCGPCVAGLPRVAAAYEKLHGQGFEVIGLSADQDKEQLAAFIKERHLPWPHYFLGEARKEIGQKFRVKVIPALYLVNKKGLLVMTNASEKLEDKVRRLLKE